MVQGVYLRKYLPITGREARGKSLRIAFNSIGIVLFLVYTVRKDFPLASLPVIGKYFRK